MEQSAVSHQLRLLRNMRIVKRRKEGKNVFYSLHDTHIEQIFQQTLQHLDTNKSHLNRLVHKPACLVL